MPTPAQSISRSRSTIVKGIKYIKINRFDKQGTDNTISLQELTNVRLKFDDLGVVDFPVLTITEYPDYYLYRVGPVVLGNSTEKFNAPINPSPAPTLNGGDSTGIVSGYTDVTGSIDGSGLYTFINGGYGVTVNYYFTPIGDPLEYTQVIFTGSSGIIHKKTFNNEDLFGAQILSASFTYVPTSGSTIGMMFSASASNTSPTYIILSSSYAASNFSITQDITSSIDNNILDHYIDASKTGTTAVAGDDSIIVTNYSTVTADILGYFNSTTGLITFGDTPNVKMYITASVTVPDNYQDFSLFGSSEGRIVMVNTSSLSGGTLILSASFTPIENSTYWLFIENNGAGASSYSNVNLLLTQSVDPVSSSVLIILEPYITSNFFYNDCNVLYGNADGLEYSANFMKVDYDGDGGNVIPSNQQQILNNTAERAPVKPYNYTLKAQTLPRYEGSRVVQQNPFLNRISGSNQLFFTGNYSWTPGDISPDKTPSVNLTTTYFAYFTFLEDTSTILKNNTLINVKYLIGEDGTLYDATSGDIVYYNLINSFESGKNTNISLFNQISPSLTSLKKIKSSGQYYTPILYNLSSSYLDSASFSSNIDFNNLQGNSSTGVPDYAFFKESSNGYYTSQSVILPNGEVHQGGTFWNSYGPQLNLNATSSIVNPFYNGTASFIGYDSQSGWVQGTPSTNYPNNPYYKFNSLADLSTIDIYTKVYMGTYVPDYPQNVGNASAVVKIWSSGSEGVKVINQSLIKSIPNLIFTGAWHSFIELTVPGYNPYVDEAIYVTVERVGGLGYLIINPLYQWPDTTNYDKSILKITTQNLQIPSVSTFWTTGSSYSTTLTSSIALGTAINGNFQQIDISGSGMPKIEYPAIILPGDEIRFEYNEENTFIITKVTPSEDTTSPITILTVDRPIPTLPSLNINHFTIRRKIKNINSIILDYKLAVPTTNGYLFPENPSDAIKANLPKITENLRSKNIIQ